MNETKKPQNGLNPISDQTKSISIKCFFDIQLTILFMKENMAYDLSSFKCRFGRNICNPTSYQWIERINVYVDYVWNHFRKLWFCTFVFKLTNWKGLPTKLNVQPLNCLHTNLHLSWYRHKILQLPKVDSTKIARMK